MALQLKRVLLQFKSPALFELAQSSFGYRGAQTTNTMFQDWYVKVITLRVIAVILTRIFLHWSCRCKFQRARKTI